MRPAPNHQIDRRAISLWQIHALFQLLFMTIFAAIAFATLRFTLNLPDWFAVFVPGFLLPYAIIVVVLAPRIRWKVWRYELDEHELDLQHGLFVVHRTLIPLIRVQHVDTVQGPIAKLFRLSAVTVSTAAGTHEVPALSDEVADNLRDRISAMARQAREQL